MRLIGPRESGPSAHSAESGNQRDLRGPRHAFPVGPHTAVMPASGVRLRTSGNRPPLVPFAAAASSPRFHSLPSRHASVVADSPVTDRADRTRGR